MQKALGTMAARWLWLAAGLGALLALGCYAGRSQGAYPVEVFPEMHYSQAFRAQEPPRLAPPEGAVPVTGREVSYTAQELQALRNPLPRSLETLESGRALFETNCATCHGPRGKGDGATSRFLQKYNYPSAPDLTAPTTQRRSDGEIYGILANGIVVMPSFKNLLSEKERWTLVHYLRALQGQ